MEEETGSKARVKNMNKVSMRILTTINASYINDD